MKRKIAAILAADVVGYSRLVAEDEEESLRRLQSYRAVFDDFVGRAGGRIFNTAGDAVLAEFQSAVDAVRCAVDLQESLRARNLAYPPSRQMCFRIGITIGDVVERDGDLLGDGVNIAARLESMSPAGGICISRSVFEAVANKVTAKFTDIGRQQLKNIPDPVHAYTITLDPQSAGKGPSSATASIAGWHWAAIVCVLVVAAGAGGFFLNHLDLAGSGKTEPTVSKPIAPEKTTAAPERRPESAGAESDSRPPPSSGATPAAGHAAPESTAPAKPPASLVGSDEVAKEAVFKRQWIRCFEGTENRPIIEACKALTGFKFSSDDQLALVHLKLGKAQRANEEVDAAIDSYSEAIRLAPSAEAYNDRGIAYFDKQEWQRAIDDYTDAIKLDSNFGEALNNRAWTQFKMGRASSAIEDANKAVRLLPDKAYAWDTRAHVQEALNNRAQAISDYRKALQLDPESDGTREALKALGAQP